MEFKIPEKISYREMIEVTYDLDGLHISKVSSTFYLNLLLNYFKSKTTPLAEKIKFIENLYWLDLLSFLNKNKSSNKKEFNKEILHEISKILKSSTTSYTAIQTVLGNVNLYINDYHFDNNFYNSLNELTDLFEYSKKIAPKNKRLEYYIRQDLDLPVINKFYKTAIEYQANNERYKYSDYGCFGLIANYLLKNDKKLKALNLNDSAIITAITENLDKFDIDLIKKHVDFNKNENIPAKSVLAETLYLSGSDRLKDLIPKDKIKTYLNISNILKDSLIYIKNGSDLKKLSTAIENLKDNDVVLNDLKEQEKIKLAWNFIKKVPGANNFNKIINIFELTDKAKVARGFYQIALLEIKNGILANNKTTNDLLDFLIKTSNFNVKEKDLKTLAKFNSQIYSNVEKILLQQANKSSTPAKSHVSKKL